MSRFFPLLLLAAGCPSPKPPADGSEESGPDGDSTPVTTPGTLPTGDPATVALRGECPLSTRLGGFVVEAYEDYSIVDGAVADGVVPQAVLEEVLAEGDCRVLRRNNPFCDPGCSSEETCDFDGTCVPYPEEQQLGTVSVLGLREEVAMEPRSPGASYFDTTLPHPAFLPDALVTLTMGGWTGEQTLHGVGFSPIVPGEPLWQLPDGGDLVVGWDVPGGVVRTEVVLRISIDQHGATPALATCVFADDGEGTVPAAVLDTLRVAGISGFPSGSLSRRTADRVEIALPETGGAGAAGCVDFVVGSPRVIDVRVEGSTPCDATEDCPPGLSCNFELEICE